MKIDKMKASVPVSNLSFELPSHSGIPGSLTGKPGVTTNLGGNLNLKEQ